MNNIKSMGDQLTHMSNSTTTSPNNSQTFSTQRDYIENSIQKISDQPPSSQLSRTSTFSPLIRKNRMNVGDKNENLSNQKIYVQTKPLSNFQVWKMSNDMQKNRIQKAKLNKKIQQVLKKSKNYCRQSQKLYLDHIDYCIKVLQLVDCTQIRILSLKFCSIDDKNIAFLAQKSWIRLQELYLDHNNIRYQGILGLVNGNLCSLQCLSLNNNYINNQGLGEVFSSLPNIRKFYVKKNLITSQGLYKIITHRSYPLLQLMLSQSLISLLGIKYLIKSNLTQLDKLYLNGCFLDKQALKTLSKGHWSNLTILDVSSKFKFPCNSCIQIQGNGWKKLSELTIGYQKSADRIINDPISLMNIIIIHYLSFKTPGTKYTSQWAWRQMRSIIKRKYFS